MKKYITLVLVLILALSVLAGCGSTATTTAATTKAATTAATTAAPTTTKAAWAPDTEIEFVVPSAAGGGSDLNARTISDIAFTNKFSPKNFKVNNMPGGSGATAFSYVATKKGSNTTLMVLHNGQIMSTLVNKSPVLSSDLTDLQIVAFDNLTLGINAKTGKYKTVEEMVTAVKANPEKVNIGGSQRGNTDHLIFEMMNKYIGVKFSYVQFNSSGEVMTALLGGHIDAGIFNPSECIGQIQSGDVKPIAAFSDKRLDGAFKDVRTMAEIGYKDVVVQEVRALSGAPGMSADAIAFYDTMIKKVTETEKWKKDYIEKNYLTPVYMTAAEAKAFWAKEIVKYSTIFKEVGVIK